MLQKIDCKRDNIIINYTENVFSTATIITLFNRRSIIEKKLSSLKRCEKKHGLKPIGAYNYKKALLSQGEPGVPDYAHGYYSRTF